MLDLKPVSDPLTEIINRPLIIRGADDPYETIKVLEAWLPPHQFLGFLRGSAIAHQAAAGARKSELAAADFDKARFYDNAAAEFARKHPELWGA